MKRKTLNGNPRLAPVSGSNNGKFGFSLNGTRRGNYMGRETNLAPGAQTGPQQMIGSSPSKPTGPGIYGHPAAVCTNDETVVKTTVINTIYTVGTTNNLNVICFCIFIFITNLIIFS